MPSVAVHRTQHIFECFFVLVFMIPQLIAEQNYFFSRILFSYLIRPKTCLLLVWEHTCISMKTIWAKTHINSIRCLTLSVIIYSINIFLPSPGVFAMRKRAHILDFGKWKHILPRRIKKNIFFSLTNYMKWWKAANGTFRSILLAFGALFTQCETEILSSFVVFAVYLNENKANWMR